MVHERPPAGITQGPCHHSCTYGCAGGSPGIGWKDWSLPRAEEWAARRADSTIDPPRYAPCIGWVTRFHSYGPAFGDCVGRYVTRREEPPAVGAPGPAEDSPVTTHAGISAPRRALRRATGRTGDSCGPVAGRVWCAARPGRDTSAPRCHAPGPQAVRRPLRGRGRRRSNRPPRHPHPVPSPPEVPS